MADPGRVAALGAYVAHDSLLQGVTVAGEHAFVVDYDGGLGVLDVDDPARPTLLATATGPGRRGRSGSVVPTGTWPRATAACA